MSVTITCDGCKKECVGDNYRNVVIKAWRGKEKVREGNSIYSHFCLECFDNFFVTDELTGSFVLKALV